MPLTERNPDAASLNYAKALFELAHDKGGPKFVEEIQGELEDLLELARADKSFSEFLATRAIAVKKRRESLERMLRGKVSDLTLNFLLLLNDRQRLSELPTIAASYDQLVQKHFGRVEVDVFTAEPVSPDMLRSIGERLGSVLGKQVVAHPYTDGAMIGGVKFRIGDQLVDASVATRLRRMSEKLSNEGSMALRAKFDRILEDK